MTTGLFASMHVDLICFCKLS